MGWTCFDVEVSDKVAHLRLNRPQKANSMIPEFWDELPALCAELDASGSVRAVVLSAVGKHFCSGMDLSVFSNRYNQQDTAEPGRTNSTMRTHVRWLQETLTGLERMRMPVIAAVQGAVVGGGVDLVCAADLRYATADAWFCVAEINIGMAADLGTLQRLPKLIGDGAARELAYTGRRLPAARAYELGLVQGVYDDQPQMLDAVLATAAEIAAKSPLAIAGTKVSMTYARDHSVSDSLEQIATWQSGMYQPADMVEAATATAQGREPDFADLPPIDRTL